MKYLYIMWAIMVFSYTDSICQKAYYFTGDTTFIKNYIANSANTRISQEGCAVKPKFKNTKIPYLKSRFILDCRNSISSSGINIIQQELIGTEISEVGIVTILGCSNPFLVNDPEYKNLSFPERGYHLNLIEAQCAWSITQGDPNVIIGIADTDFETIHSDLSTKYSNVDGPVSGQLPHGTQVSGFAAPNTNNNLGVAGIGFNCRMDGQRVNHLTNGTTSFDEIVDAINRCFNNGDRIINISWSSTGLSANEAQAFVNAGAVLVVAAGNAVISTGHDAIGNITGVVLVSSVNQDNNAHPKHAKNQFVDVCAPGVNLFTTNTNNTYINGGGTSFASPIVAGTVGLMRSANPCLTPVEVHNMLQRTCDPISDANLYPNQVGAGRINAYKAVKESVTKYFQNTTITNLISGRAFVNIGSNITNSIPFGPVSVASNSSWIISAREVNIENDFTVPLGSELTINIDPNYVLGCP